MYWPFEYILLFIGGTMKNVSAIQIVYSVNNFRNNQIVNFK